MKRRKSVHIVELAMTVCCYRSGNCLESSTDESTGILCCLQAGTYCGCWTDPHGGTTDMTIILLGGVCQEGIMIIPTRI